MEEISEKNFFIELKDEEDKIISNNNKISKEKKNKFANILCDINVLKNFSGIIKELIISKIEINIEEFSLFKIKPSNFYLILSPLSYQNNIIIKPIISYQFEISDSNFNSIINKYSCFTFDEKIEILFPIYEIISLNKFKNAGVKLLELTCKMLQKKNKKNVFKEIIFLLFKNLSNFLI